MRLDEWLVSQGLAKDLKEAAGIIMSANVLINDAPVTSPARKVVPEDKIRLRNQKKWVARSGEKLDFALEHFQIDVKDKICLDVGASTGGFTQALLNRGARTVVAVDVAYGFLHPLLRNNPKVIVFERTHICDLKPEDLPEAPDFFAVDVSFISIRKIIHCLKLLYGAWQGVVLFKPQFEAPREELVNGIVRDSAVLERLLREFRTFLGENHIDLLNEAPSPIEGKKGNREFLYHIRWG